MTRDARLLFGPLGFAIFVAGIVALPFFVPGYDSVRQTVSEIGEMDSPMRWPFAIMLWSVATCLIVFAFGLRRASIEAAHNWLSAFLVVCMAVCAAGIGYFAFPHPLHNVFGESELIGYQAPLAFALAWRRDARARGVVAFSWIMFALLWLSIALNLAQLIGGGALWHIVKPFYGLVQRSLFIVFFGWVAGAGWMLWRRSAVA